MPFNLGNLGSDTGMQAMSTQSYTGVVNTFSLVLKGYSPSHGFLSVDIRLNVN